MAGELEGGFCGGNWWNLSQNLFGLSSCSLPIDDVGSFKAWPSHDLLTDMIKNTTRSSDDSTGYVSDKSVVLQEFGKSPQANTDRNMTSIDSTFNMIESSFFPSTNTDQHDWNQDLVLDNGRSDQNYSHLLQEATPHNSSMNHRHQTRHNLCEDSSPMNSSVSIPTSSASYSYNSVQNLLRHLFDTDSQSEQSLEDNYSLPLINSNDFLADLPKTSSIPKIKEQNHLQLSNKTPFWNATPDMDNFHIILRRQSEFLPSSINNNFALKRLNNEEVGEISTKPKKSTDGPTFKRPRIETPSPLPTFKVRKEKMGDRITALQQLVSPFGKTDTASVLLEAIEYIKFLHDQVNALSTPYLKSGSPPLQCQQATSKIRHHEELNQDLKSRSLCLVPVSRTFPVASETTAGFWKPTFGGSFL